MTDLTTDSTVSLAKIKPNFTLDTRAVIVCWMMISSFAIIFLCWWKPPAGDSQLLNTLIGMYVGTGFIGAIQWWMGSSKGSDDKNAMLTGK